MHLAVHVDGTENHECGSMHAYDASLFNVYMHVRDGYTHTRTCEYVIRTMANAQPPAR
jgi:hypothetical protein